MVNALMQFGLYWEKASISDVFITVKKKKNNISNAASLLKTFNGQCKSNLLFTSPYSFNVYSD